MPHRARGGRERAATLSCCGVSTSARQGITKTKTRKKGPIVSRALLLEANRGISLVGPMSFALDGCELCVMHIIRALAYNNDYNNNL